MCLLLQSLHFRQEFIALAPPLCHAVRKREARGGSARVLRRHADHDRRVLLFDVPKVCICFSSRIMWSAFDTVSVWLHRKKENKYPIRPLVTFFSGFSLFVFHLTSVAL